MPQEITGPPPTEALREAVIFTGFDEGQLALIVPYLRYLQFGQGEPVFHQGDAGHELFVIVNGLVTIRDPGPVRGSGRDVQVLRAGTVFGEISFLDSQPRSMDAICGTATTVAALGQEPFYVLVADQPLIGAALLHNLANVICGRLRRANRELLELTLQGRGDLEADTGVSLAGPGLYQRLSGPGGS
jgi:CRP-like cAMP-binding protein